MANQKIRVAVLYGGKSGEHEVSLLSAVNVIRNLDPAKFEVIPIGIDRQGTWFLGDDVLRQELASGKSLRLNRLRSYQLFTPDQVSNIKLSSTELAEKLKTDKLFDVVFPAIHGIHCEDGTVQGFLELANLPYVGCGVLSSAITMDKDVAKRLVSQAGVKVAPYLMIKRGQWENNRAAFCQEIVKQLPFPVFVKPANTGSSIGIEKVKQVEDLAAAIDQAFQFDVKVLVEKAIDAIELEISVLESLNYGEDPIVSVVGEIRPQHEFYSYTAKYLDEKGAELIIPADISKELQEVARAEAKKIFYALECEGMSRVDLFLERGTNNIYFNEVNSIPGFTQISMYPKLLAASGIEYQQLLTHLVMLAIERYKRKNALIHEYAETTDQCLP